MRSTRMKTEPARFAALALAAGLCVSACKSGVAPPIGEDREGPPQYGGILRTAFFLDVRGLDAATAFDTSSSAIESLVYDGLVTYDASGKVVPLLAEKLDISPDGKRYVFHLRRGVLFHD